MGESQRDSPALCRETSWSGWLAVLVLWTHGFIWVGIVKSLAMMLPVLKDQFDSETWILGWMIAMIQAMNGITGPFSSSLRDKFGAAWVVTVSGAMIAAAVITGSFVQTALQEGMVYMLLAGAGYGVSNVLTKDAVGRLFDKNYATAVGVARTGYSAALFVFAPLVQLFLDTYGWRGTMLLLGGITMHLAACGALLRIADKPTHREGYQTLNSSPETSSGRNNILKSCGRFLKSIVMNLNLGLLSKFSYWSVYVIYVTSKYAIDSWVIYFVSLSQSCGLSLEEAATIVTVAGVGNLLAKVGQGIVTDRGILPYWVLLAVATAISAAAFCATPWLATYWTLMASALLILIADGVVSCLSDVLTKQVIGVELLASAYGWIGIQNTICRFTLGFIPGLIFDTTGSYSAAFVFIGCLQLISLSLLFALRYFKHVK
ncbi:monocarboxylate transporter 12-like [Patiria miniata]|uniref:Major facilitator superfamily (MFS) profile domain-containing protein n=1 Tax=Patiria miniata TaxID=46514 RepID=A0A914AQR2_PATMI|nr:monocarboxylate transporter 12-like [Patiria miniata]